MSQDFNPSSFSSLAIFMC